MLSTIIDNKLSLEQHTQSVMKKLPMARGIISKLSYYAPLSILSNIYFSIVYSRLQSGVTTLGNSAAKFVERIQIQQNYIIKVMTKSSSIKTKLNPLYQKLNLLKLNNIFKLEVLKFMYNYQNKSLLKCFPTFSLSLRNCTLNQPNLRQVTTIQ